MADVDLTFLGEQIKRMQSDLRLVRAEQLRLEADVMERLDAIERSVDGRFNAVDARFEQVHRTMAANLDVLLAAIKDSKGK